MTLRTTGNRAVEITSVRVFTAQQVTYDLTIAGVHTYYVLAGKTPVLVHNSNCLIAGSGPAQGCS
ncbi:hypothetical protein [Streptomyces sp. SudanB135_2055]|uniref:hypothetical protein n=1 Tax=Streptomyces sp. SudanB135_2055 TaxID=3035279 RepID=UPI0036DF11BD